MTSTSPTIFTPQSTTFTTITTHLPPTKGEAIAKVIFRLIGQISNKPKYIYDVSIHPDKKDAIASVKHKDSNLIKHHTHYWNVKYINFPKEFTLKQISELMIRQHPAIKVSKEKSIEQLNLEAESYDRQYPVKVEIGIKGTTHQGKEYYLKLCPDNLENSAAYIKDEQGNPVQVSLNLGPLKDYRYKDIRNNVLPNFNSKYQVNLAQEAKGPCLRLTTLAPFTQQVAPASGEFQQAASSLSISSSQILPRAEPLFSIRNTQDLTNYLAGEGSKDPLIDEIVKKMVDSFTQLQQPSAEAIKEVIKLFDKLEEDDQFRILQSLTAHFVDNPLIDKNILQALTDILVHFQKFIYQDNLEISPRQPSQFSSMSAEFLNKLESKHLVNMLRILTDNLKPTARPKENSLIKQHLRVIIALIEAMLIKEVEGVDKEIYIKAYEAISQFTKDEDLEVAYLARYGENSFLKISDDRTTGDIIKDVGARTFYFLRAVAKIADAVDLFEPWHIASAFDAPADFQKAFAFQGPGIVKKVKEKWFPEDWFNVLFKVRYTLFEYPHIFVKAINALSTDVEIQKKETLHHPFFLMGFVNLLWEVLHFPPSASLDDLELKKVAVQLFKQIYQANDTQKNYNPQEAFSLKKERNRTQLQEITKRYLLTCTTHPQQEIRELAKGVVNALSMDKSQITSFESAPLTALFTEAIKKVPLFETMQRIAEKLRKDDQLKKERAYYISSKASDPERQFSNPLPLAEELKGFFKSESTYALHLEGEGGAGKTLAMKMLADQLLKNYSHESYFPLYTYLPKLKDPIHKALEHTLDFYGVDRGQANQLRERKILLICDAYDEINFDRFSRRFEDPKKINIYVTNGFKDKEISKVIFVSKTGTAKKRCFKPQGEDLQRLRLTPFDEAQIVAYLKRFVAERQKDKTLLWTEQEYLNNFQEIKNSSLGKVITNPFHLKITVEVLPIIVKRYLSEHPGLELEKIFHGQKKFVILKELFDVFACVTAYRSSVKTAGGHYISPQEYLNYSIQLALKMGSRNRTFIPWPPENYVGINEQERNDIQNSFRDFFEPVNSKERFYKECLIQRNEGWSFIHKDYQEYLDYLGGKRPAELEEFIKRIVREYKFKELF
ncbi:hypothetical protein DB42_BP00280 [Neochlamydia sp. EPS4]|uniref:NACHT domain-containing protein n=1 Tax=Neochlamydia sp. EPS4 TaxID=1478175 RepID=UPI000582653B|nr:hypothetical protein [Neochlamydia sp. EPS4]KIC73847.1 hypothetical protein DB42_BP00280 [Neochlamydia sp. EPS4]